MSLKVYQKQSLFLCFLKQSQPSVDFQESNFLFDALLIEVFYLLFKIYSRNAFIRVNFLLSPIIHLRMTNCNVSAIFFWSNYLCMKSLQPYLVLVMFYILLQNSLKYHWFSLHEQLNSNIIISVRNTHVFITRMVKPGCLLIVKILEGLLNFLGIFFEVS